MDGIKLKYLTTDETHHIYRHTQNHPQRVGGYIDVLIPKNEEVPKQIVIYVDSGYEFHSSIRKAIK